MAQVSHAGKTGLPRISVDAIVASLRSVIDKTYGMKSLRSIFENTVFFEKILCVLLT